VVAAGGLVAAAALAGTAMVAALRRAAPRVSAVLLGKYFDRRNVRIRDPIMVGAAPPKLRRVIRQAQVVTIRCGCMDDLGRRPTRAALLTGTARTTGVVTHRDVAVTGQTVTTTNDQGVRQ